MAKAMRKMQKPVKIEARSLETRSEKSIKERLAHVKKRIKERISFPYLLFLTIVVIIILLFVLGIKIPFGNEPPSAIVDNRAIRFLNLYYGISNITINNKTLQDNIWKIDANGYSADGIVNMNLEMSATDFKVLKVTQNLVIPSEPLTIKKTGKEVGCSVGDLIAVDVYIDPYDPWSIKYDSTITNFTSMFKNNIYLNYRIVSTYTYKYITSDPKSTAYDALKYYECTKTKPYFQEFKACVISKYNEKKEFLSVDELNECVAKVGGNATEVSACSNDNYPMSELATDQRFAETFLGASTSPMIVIDCRYSVYPLFAENAFCYLYPKLEQCKD